MKSSLVLISLLFPHVVSTMGKQPAIVDETDHEEITVGDLQISWKKSDYQKCLRSVLSKEDQVWRAIQNDDIQELKLLLDGKNSLALIRDTRGRTPLYMAATHFSPKVIPLLVAAGADVNDKENDWKATPLVKAVDTYTCWNPNQKENQNATVLALLAVNADPSITDGQGRNALVVAKLYNGDRAFVSMIEAKMKRLN